MTQDRKQWVLAMIAAARPTAEKIGISPEAIVAQAALESGWGKSAIGNNLFGIKADSSWHGKVQMRRTREENPDGTSYYIDARFRDYDTLADGIADHFSFLDGNSRYRNAGVFDKKGDAHYFRALQRAGYATANDYAETLMQVLRSVIHFRDMPGAAAGSTPAAKPRTLRAGMEGDDVRALQRALNTQNADMLEDDGKFDSTVVLAVRRFQEGRGLAVDGVAGRATLSALGLWPA